MNNIEAARVMSVLDDLLANLRCVVAAPARFQAWILKDSMHVSDLRLF